MSGLSDIYNRNLRATDPRAEGVYIVCIRIMQTRSVYGISTTYVALTMCGEHYAYLTVFINDLTVFTF